MGTGAQARARLQGQIRVSAVPICAWAGPSSRLAGEVGVRRGDVRHGWTMASSIHLGLRLGAVAGGFSAAARLEKAPRLCGAG